MRMLGAHHSLPVTRVQHVADHSAASRWHQAVRSCRELDCCAVITVAIFRSTGCARCPRDAREASSLVMPHVTFRKDFALWSLHMFT